MGDQSGIPSRSLVKPMRRSQHSVWAWLTLGSLGLWLAIAPPSLSPAQAQTAGTGTITLKADIQEANAVTGVIVARGNVRIDYPARDIIATSAQAQYFSQENRMILSGNVVVLQEGNRLEAETVTYLVDEGRFIALPEPNDQVETTYIIQDTPTSPAADETNEEAESEPLTPDETLRITPLD